MPIYDPTFASVSQIQDPRMIAKRAKEAKAETAAKKAEEGARIGVERQVAGERSAIMDFLMKTAQGAETTIGLTDEQKKAAEFLTNVMNGSTLPVDARTQAAMLAQAQDPLAAEYSAAQSNLRNLYGSRGFGQYGGGELEGLRQLRMGTLQEQARAGQQSILGAANANIAARLQAANIQAGLGNQSAGIRQSAINALTGYALQAPITSQGGSYVPKLNVPLQQQPSQNVVSF